MDHDRHLTTAEMAGLGLGPVAARAVAASCRVSWRALIATASGSSRPIAIRPRHGRALVRAREGLANAGVALACLARCPSPKTLADCLAMFPKAQRHRGHQPPARLLELRPLFAWSRNAPRAEAGPGNMSRNQRGLSHSDAVVHDGQVILALDQRDRAPPRAPDRQVLSQAASFGTTIA